MSEEILERVLRYFTQSDEVVIATKAYGEMGGNPYQRGLSRYQIMRAVNASIRRLSTEYIDLYQIHRWDNETPIDGTLETLNDLVRMGKVRYISASSMYA